MKFSKIFFVLIVLDFLLPACEYTLNRDLSNLATLDVNNLIIETPGTADVLAGEFQLKQNSTLQLGCQVGTNAQPTTGAGDSGVSLNSTNYFLGFTFSFSYPIKPSAVLLRLSSSGAPTATAVVKITDASATPSPMGTIKSTSSILSMSSVSPSYADQSFTFSSPPTLAANTAYGLVLEPVANSGSIDASNNISWSRGDTASDCSSFHVNQLSSNGGNSWSSLPTRPYFYFQVPGYANTGSGYWIVDGQVSTEWDLSSFNVSENPSGDKSGTIVYSIGAGSNPSSPTYSSNDLTLTQVKALPNVTGRYLYVQVKLTSTNNNIVNAGTASGSISIL